MLYESLGAQALDYAPCRYGGSRILFRGPYRKPEGRYTVYLGGSETYGRFAETPFPTLIEGEGGLPAVNLGCVNAGIDVYLGDPALIDIARKSEQTVIQVLGAQNVSNRFYTVHPRRNDRMVRVSGLLGKFYPEIDTTDIHFTRHLLTELHEASEQKFAIVRDELQEAWVARMRALIRAIGGRIILLWLSDRLPEETGLSPLPFSEPLFVTRDMLDALGDRTELLEVVPSAADLKKGRAALRCTAMERPAADEMLGTIAHRHVADALRAHLATG